MQKHLRRIEQTSKAQSEKKGFSSFFLITANNGISFQGSMSSDNWNRQIVQVLQICKSRKIVQWQGESFIERIYQTMYSQKVGAKARIK